MRTRYRIISITIGIPWRWTSGYIYLRKTRFTQFRRETSDHY